MQSLYTRLTGSVGLSYEDGYSKIGHFLRKPTTGLGKYCMGDHGRIGVAKRGGGSGRVITFLVDFNSVWHVHFQMSKTVFKMTLTCT